MADNSHEMSRLIFSEKQNKIKIVRSRMSSARMSSAAVCCVILFVLFVLRFYGQVNPMGSCRARSVYLTIRLLGRLSPLSG